MTARSWLFAPGDSPAKIAKATASGADAVILDLEDSVAATRKAEARAAVTAALEARAPDGPELWVRINPWGSPLAEADLAAVAHARPNGLVLPKAESAQTVVNLGRRLDQLGPVAADIHVLAIATETPRSIFTLGGYADAGPRLAGLTWGAEDLSAAIGAVSPRDEGGALTPLYALARSLCLAGAAAAGAPAIETVYPDFRDLDGLSAYAARGRRDGFVGMMAIHPAQVGPINAAFTPTQAEVERARRVVDLFEADPAAGVLALDGSMLDAPHLAQARAVLARWSKLHGGG